MSERLSYDEWKKVNYPDKKTKKSEKNKVSKNYNLFWGKIHNIATGIIYFLIICAILYIPIMNLIDPNSSNFLSSSSIISKEINLSKTNWNSDQLSNIKVVIDNAKKVNHPNPKRMVSILLTESSAITVMDGDKGNGFGKKSYGVLQVKLDSVYYVKNKRPDLISKYLPEVNVLAKEDVLHLLRKDKVFNATIGSLLHIVLMDVCKSEKRATVAYNRGVCKPDDLGDLYLNKVSKNELKI